MALVIGTDSWATVEEADQYNGSLPFNGGWSTQSEANREKYLRLAYYILNDLVVWTSSADFTGKRIKDIQSELAYQFTQNNTTLNSDLVDQGIISMANGIMSFNGRAVKVVLPDVVINRIPTSWYTEIRGRSVGRYVQVKRS